MLPNNYFHTLFPQTPTQDFSGFYAFLLKNIDILVACAIIITVQLINYFVFKKCITNHNNSNLKETSSDKSATTTTLTTCSTTKSSKTLIQYLAFLIWIVNFIVFTHHLLYFKPPSSNLLNTLLKNITNTGWFC